jgi:hypothetical protein
MSTREVGMLEQCNRKLDPPLPYGAALPPRRAGARSQARRHSPASAIRPRPQNEVLHRYWNVSFALLTLLLRLPLTVVIALVVYAIPGAQYFIGAYVWAAIGNGSLCTNSGR